MVELKCLRCGSSNLVDEKVEHADIYAFVGFDTDHEEEINADLDILGTLNLKMLVCKDCGHVEFFSKKFSNILDAKNKELASPELEPLLKELSSYEDEIKEIQVKIQGKDETQQWVKESQNRITRLNNKILNTKYAIDNVKRKYNLD